MARKKYTKPRNFKQTARDLMLAEPDSVEPPIRLQDALTRHNLYLQQVLEMQRCEENLRRAQLLKTISSQAAAVAQARERRQQEELELEQQAKFKQVSKSHIDVEKERRRQERRERKLKKQAEVEYWRNRRAEAKRYREARIKREAEIKREARAKRKADIKRDIEIKREARAKRKAEINREAEIKRLARAKRKVEIKFKTKARRKARAWREVKRLERHRRDESNCFERTNETATFVVSKVRASSEQDECNQRQETDDDNTDVVGDDMQHSQGSHEEQTCQKKPRGRPRKIQYQIKMAIDIHDDLPYIPSGK